MAKKRDLSQENKELKRENSRLKKKVSQLEGSIGAFSCEEEEPEEKETESPRMEPVLTTPCPKCGGETGRIELGKYSYLICQSGQCRYRERIRASKNK